MRLADTRIPPTCAFGERPMARVHGQAELTSKLPQRPSMILRCSPFSLLLRLPEDVSAPATPHEIHQAARRSQCLVRACAGFHRARTIAGRTITRIPTPTSTCIHERPAHRRSVGIVPSPNRGELANRARLTFPRVRRIGPAHARYILRRTSADSHEPRAHQTFLGTRQPSSRAGPPKHARHFAPTEPHSGPGH